MDTLSIVIMIISLFVLLACSAFFSGSETALMAVNRMRLTHIAKTKPKKVRVVEHLLKKPEQLIGTMLLGNTLANVAMTSVATAIAISFYGETGIAYATGVLTFAILIFAEITPKVYSKYFNEQVSLITAPILKIIMNLFNPIVIGVTFLASKILLLLGVNISKIKKPLLTEDELRTYIQLGQDDGAITCGEKNMLSRVFTLNEKTVGEIMLPRDRMTVLDINVPFEKIIKTVLDKGYSRFPVTNGKNTDIVGFIHTKDLLNFFNAKKPVSLRKIIRPPYFISDDKKIDSQLRSFKAKRLHQAVVLNREGEIAGLITLEDILEELVGNIQDEHDQK